MSYGEDYERGKRNDHNGPKNYEWHIGQQERAREHQRQVNERQQAWERSNQRTKSSPSSTWGNPSSTWNTNTWGGERPKKTWFGGTRSTNASSSSSSGKSFGLGKVLAFGVVVFVGIGLMSDSSKKDSNARSSQAPVAPREETIPKTRTPPSAQQPTDPVETPPSSVGQWPIAYIMPGTWGLASPESMQILKQNIVNISLPIAKIVNRVVEFRCHKLLFYEGGQMCEGVLDDRQNVVDIVNLRNGDTFVLNGDSELIHSINSRNKLNVETPELATEYLMFFCGGIADKKEGNWRIIRTVSDLNWQALPTEQDLQQASANMQTVSWQKDVNGNWHGVATVQYGQALFNGKFTVQPSGNVAMDEDRPILESKRLGRDTFHGVIRTAF